MPGKLCVLLLGLAGGIWGQKPELVLQTGPTESTGMVTFSPDNTMLAAMNQLANTVRIYSVATGAELATLDTGAENAPTPLGQPGTLRFSRDGQALWTLAGGSFRQFETRTGMLQLSRKFKSGGSEINGWEISADGRLAFGKSLSAAIPPPALDLEQGGELIPHYTVLALSEDARLAVTGGLVEATRQRSPYVWSIRDLATGRVTGGLEPLPSMLNAKGQFRRQSVREVTALQLKIGMGSGSFRFSSNGKLVARLWGGDTNRKEISVTLFELPGGRQRTVTVGTATDIGSPSIEKRVALTQDLKLAAAGQGLQVSIVDLESGQTAATLAAGTAEVAALAFSTDRKLLATVAVDGSIGIWDVSQALRGTVTSLRRMGESALPVHAVEFTQDGRGLVVGTTQSVNVWELEGGTSTRSLSVPFEAPASQFAKTEAMFATLTILSRGGQVVAARGPTKITVWESRSGRELASYRSPPGSSLSQADLTHGGEMLMVTETQGYRTEQDAKRLSALTELHAKQYGKFVTELVIADSKRDGKKADEIERRAREELPSELADSLALYRRSRRSPSLMNGKSFENFMIEILKADLENDTRKSDELERWARQELSPEYAELVPDLRKMALDASRALPQAKRHAKNQAFLENWRAQFQSYASIAPYGQSKLIRLATGEVVWKAHVGGVGGASPDGRWLVRPGFRSAVQTACRLTLVDRESGGETNAKIDDCLAPGLMTFSSDGRLLAATYVGAKLGDKGLPVPHGAGVRVWALSAKGFGRAVLSIEHPLPGRIRFSPDSKFLAVSTGAGSPVRLVDIASGDTRVALNLSNQSVSSMSFSPDAKLIAVGSPNGETELRDTATGKHLASLILLNGGTDWLVVTPDGLFDGTPVSWKQILWRFSDNVKDVAPVESYFTEFFYPGLLAELVRGNRPKAPGALDQKDRRQPSVRIAAEGTGRNVTVKVTVAEPEPGVGARDVRLFRNGTLVKVWRGDVLKGQKEVALQAAIPVIAGENRLTAYAFNRDNIKSLDATLVVEGAASLVRKGVAYVLAVGVNRYANADYNLRYAVADAAAFAEEVRVQQDKLNVYERVEVLSLTDAQATKARVLETLRTLAAKAQPEDLVLLFFAGHGFAHGARFYQVPHDLGYAGPRTRLDAAGLGAIAQHSISDTELESAVEGLDSGQLLLVIDACNSGQALEAEEKRRGPMNSKGLAQLAYEKGMYILTAAQSYQAALEASELGHGYLTYTLVEEGLKKGAADYDARDGQILAREWFNYAVERVPQLQERDMATRLLVFVADEDPKRKTVQKPRVFQRREGEARPLVVGKP